MTIKQLNARFKAADNAAGGEVRMLISSFTKTPDAYGDIIAEGAFDRTIKDAQEAGRIIPLNYGHVMDDPEFCIGSIAPDTLVKTSEGIEATAMLDLENPKARATHRLIKSGTITGVSIGYAVAEAAWVKHDDIEAYELRDLDLYEVSIVQIPANRDAQVLDVKNADTVSRAEFQKLADTVAALSKTALGTAYVTIAAKTADDAPGATDTVATATDSESSDNPEVTETGAKSADLIKKHYGALFGGLAL